MLIAYRFIQAVGGCAAQVASTAMVQDFFPMREGAKIFSFLMLMIGTSPLLAPSIGSFIASSFGWLSIFALLGLLVLAIAAISYMLLPEGQPPDRSVSLTLKPIAEKFGVILKNRQFFTYALAGSFAFAGLFVYITGSPEILMGTFHVSKKLYGGLFALLSVGFIGGSQLNILLGRRYRSVAIFRLFLSLQAALSLVFLLCLIKGISNLPLTISFLFLLLTCLGIASPNATAIALAPFSKNIGSASAVFGFLQMGVGAVMSTCVGLFSFSGILPTAAILFLSAAIGCSVLFFGKRKISLLIE